MTDNQLGIGIALMILSVILVGIAAGLCHYDGRNKDNPGVRLATFLAGGDVVLGVLFLSGVLG